jgi:NodT family efflux transporter outer membrane factor (OMF) lipoprotein
MRGWGRNIVLVYAVFVLSACSLHDPKAQKVMDFADHFTQDSGRVEDGRVSTHRWWEMYNDEKLNQLMDRGFAGNLDLEMAWARLQQAEAQEEMAGANQFPQVDGSAGTGRSQSIPVLSSYEQHQLSVAAGYELDVWQKLANERSMASFFRQASENDLKAVYVSLSAQIAEIYYLVLELRAKVELNGEVIEFFEKTVELVRRRYERGIAPSLDLYQAKQNLLNARAEMPGLKSDLIQAENSLALLLGFRPQEQDLGEFSSLPDVTASYDCGLPSELLAHRPDVEAAYLRLQATDSAVAVAIAERFPRFSLTADYGSRSSELSDLLQNPNIFWNVLAGVSAPLFDGGRRKANVRYTEARFREQLAAYHQTVLRAFGDVEDSLSRERGMDARYVQLLAYKEVTGATLRLSLQRYQLGIDTFLPVLTAQASHSQALMAVITAKRKKISSRIQLARALGGTWMVDEMKTQKDES